MSQQPFNGDVWGVFHASQLLAVFASREHAHEWVDRYRPLGQPHSWQLPDGFEVRKLADMGRRIIALIAGEDIEDEPPSFE